MVMNPHCLDRFESVRALIRYVDRDQAVIEVNTVLNRHVPNTSLHDMPTRSRALQLRLELRSNDGFHDEHQMPLRLRHRRSTVRLDVVEPRRWWPSGMGDQALYDLTVSLLDDGKLADQWETSIGFTSVRPCPTPQTTCETLLDDGVCLMVNGESYDIGSVVPIDQVDEHRLLPASGDSLLLVRDHYGADILYDAADRAGIMLVQCVPIHPGGRPESNVRAQVSRLCTHPSLAGWFVGHLGDVSNRIAHRLRRLDPTHTLITELANR